MSILYDLNHLIAMCVLSFAFLHRLFLFLDVEYADDSLDMFLKYSLFVQVFHSMMLYPFAHP